MSEILTYIQIALAAAVVVTILLQQKGSGLSGAFGGGSMEYSTKRGLEKGIFYTTIVLAVIWLSISIARLLIT